MKKCPLLIYSHGGGRLGNQLLVFSHLLSWYWENPNYRLINLSFWEYAELFETTRHNAICYFSEEELLRREFYSICIIDLCLLSNY
jgi:hypothetical protein